MLTHSVFVLSVKLSLVEEESAHLEMKTTLGEKLQSLRDRVCVHGQDTPCHLHPDTQAPFAVIDGM